MSVLFGLVAFAVTWAVVVFALGYLSAHLQLLRLLVFVQPYKAITTAAVFALALWAGISAFSAIA